MSSRVNLLDRISNAGRYYYVTCYIKNGKVSFDDGQGNHCCWELPVSSELGVTAAITIRDIDTGAYECRDLNLNTGTDEVHLRVTGHEQIKIKTTDIFAAYKNWKRSDEVVGVQDNHVIKFIPKKEDCNNG